VRQTAGKPSPQKNPSPLHGADTETSQHLDITTFVIGFEGALSSAHISLIVNALEEFAGPRLWRVKGLLWTDDSSPLLINVAGSRVYPPKSLDFKNSIEAVSRLIFIVAPDLRSKIEIKFAELGGHYSTGNAFELD